MTGTTKRSRARKALIILSSARTLPVSEPVDHPPISTGFFLIELAQILREFEHTHEFTFCTPDGAVPQLDINGLSLPFMATDRLTAAVVSHTLAPTGFAGRRTDLVARRAAELDLAYRHLGALPVSAILPKTDPEAAAFRDEVASKFGTLPQKDYLSARTVIEWHRDPDNPFSLTDFDFIHFPGGHAPMVDFRDSPWLGEIINLAYEEKVLLSLICHAPVAMTSARFRIDQKANPRDFPSHPFRGAKLTTVPKHGELVALASNYPKIPGKKTRLAYYVDEALQQAGYDVRLSLNPAAVRVVWEPHLRLMTSNGPQSIDAQTKQLRLIVG
ncbi:hypothetical protein KZ798_13505 [Pseudomonas aeruginosa]|nr:hypothetical protein B8A60_14535 [Pseudomonas aeruginosa]QYE74315.1 hypothetical protein KZ798_13505 [Pseudomonas aeruginosa]